MTNRNLREPPGRTRRGSGLASKSKQRRPSSSLIHLAKELYTSYLAQQRKDRDGLSSPEVVIFQGVKLLGLSNEAFMVIYINVKNEVLDYFLMQEGTLDNVAVYPRHIIEAALSGHASGVILVHNHLSGNPLPSSEDKILTREIADTAFALDIRVLDHLIVGKQGYSALWKTTCFH